MTDEQTKAVKALRDICVRQALALVNITMPAYYAGLLSRGEYNDNVLLDIQATDAIKAVERWIT